MNLVRMQSSLAALFEQWLEDRGMSHVNSRAAEHAETHDLEWIRFKAAIDQALRGMDQQLRE